MKILLTNDDGYKSPLYTNLAKLLLKEKWVTSLTLVAPAHEQSWIGSAITTHFNITHNIVNAENFEIHTLTGTPADCTMIGTFHLCKERPDLVISGINFGTNAGSAFCISSGTLAAARQAALIGIPAVACSALLAEDVRQGWKNKDFEYINSKSEYLCSLSEYHLDLLRICHEKGYFEKNSEFEYLSINSPLELSNKELTATSVKDTKYKDLFLKVDEKTFRHKFMGFREEEIPLNLNSSTLPSDLDVLTTGKPTVTFFKIGVGDTSPTII